MVRSLRSDLLGEIIMAYQQKGIKKLPSGLYQTPDHRKWPKLGLARQHMKDVEGREKLLTALKEAGVTIYGVRATLSIPSLYELIRDNPKALAKIVKAVNA